MYEMHDSIQVEKPIDVCLHIIYTVGMNNIQYTIRNVPPELDKALRIRSKKRKQSFNTTLIEALKLSDTSNNQQSNSDLDWFYGSGGLGKAELDSFSAQRVIDKTAWDS